MFVFYPGDCLFESEPSPTSAHACEEVTKRLASVAPEVDLRECTLHSPPQKVNKAEPTLALKPRGDVTRNLKQGYQWPQKRTCVRQKLFFKVSLMPVTSFSGPILTSDTRYGHLILGEKMIDLS